MQIFQAEVHIIWFAIISNNYILQGGELPKLQFSKHILYEYK